MKVFIAAVTALAIVAGIGKLVANNLSALRQPQPQQYSDSSSSGIVHALRVKPNEDLYKAIVGYCVERKLSAVSIVSVVGSLRQASLRMANENIKVILPPKGSNTTYEIVSLVGTVSPLTPDGSLAHLHMSLSDATG
jgi:predicted DNA-binding protein with PD1-like motif